MSEMEKKQGVGAEPQEENSGIDELVRAAFGEGAVNLDGETGGSGETEGFEGFLELMHQAAEERNAEAAKEIRREAVDSIMLGGLCALGVVSLIAAAMTGVWIPVAVGLGICLSGGAGALVYRGLEVLRG